MPANQLYSLLFSIEQATVAIARKHPQLTDKHVEAVYLSYRDFFKAVRSGKDLEPPTSTIRMKDDLLNEIWEVLLMREENGHDARFCDGSWSPGGIPVTSVEQLYILAFNEVRKSVRLWRKEDGRKNYLKHIEAHVAEHIPLEMTSHHPAITDGTDGPEYLALNKDEPDLDFAKSEYGLLLSEEDVHGMPPEIFSLRDDNFGCRQDTAPQTHIKYVSELAEQYPNEPLVANELTNAYFRAGDYETGNRLAEENYQRFPGNVFLAIGPIMRTKGTPAILEEAHRLGEDLDISHFPPGKGGYYQFLEFTLHEHTAICILLARGGWELAHLRFERLLRIGLQEVVWRLIAIDFVFHFFENIDQYINERDDGLPTPNAVVEAPLASLAVKKRYSEEVVRIMGSGESRRDSF